MRLRLGLALVGALLSTGCARERPYHGDVTFTAEERASVEAGLRFLYSQIGDEYPGIVWDVEGAECENFHILRGTAAGGYYDGAKCMWVGPVQPWHMPAIAAHEAAHALGMRHVDGSTSLMSSVAVLTWSPEDEAECRRVGVCSGDE